MSRASLLRWSRRRFLGFLAGGAAVGVGAWALRSELRDDEPAISLPDLAAGLPAAQHAWDAVLGHSQHGNAIPPRFHRLLFFSLQTTPAPDDAIALEAALRTLEGAYPWAPEGLLTVAGWGPAYFASIRDGEPPVEWPEPLSDQETPELDAYDLCLHLASDDEARLTVIEAALIDGDRLPNGTQARLPSVLRHGETRTGFVGDGLPAAHQDVEGIPPGDLVHPTAPLFMGFGSGFVKNQASEDNVTIVSGEFAGGTTMHISRLRLDLEDWYGVLDQEERGQRMFAPHLTSHDIADFTDDPDSGPGLAEFDARRYGIVGHAQLVGGARRDDQPIILRRDFNTVDGGQAGLHFVALQRSIEDFNEVRRAMNGADAPGWSGSIEERTNNGIKRFIEVTHRANYLVPTRAQRSFPGLTRPPVESG